MPHEFFHQDEEFADLIRIVSDQRPIDAVLVEKDYWIMHCLYGLQQMGLSFELKGGTSLSKGYDIIERFSEDIDIRIEPPKDMDVATNPNQQKKAHDESRKAFYDWLAKEISIDGITSVVRDPEFDDDHYRSGGIRLHYDTQIGTLAGLKDGILLEVGFDVVIPNMPRTISSWAYDFAAEKIEVIDNKAVDVACYHPGYTFVEKLQTISTKFWQQQNLRRCLCPAPDVVLCIQAGLCDYHGRVCRGSDHRRNLNDAYLGGLKESDQLKIKQAKHTREVTPYNRHEVFQPCSE